MQTKPRRSSKQAENKAYGQQKDLDPLSWYQKNSLINHQTNKK